MAFTVDHSAANSLKPEGKYEVIVEKAKPSFTKSNKPCINFVLVIRNDVPNPTKGGKLFTSLYKRREPTPADLAVDGYSAAQVQGWCKAAQIPNGKRFESVEDLCESLTGALVCISVQHQTDDAGRTRENVSWPEPTQHPDCRHQHKDAAAAPAEFTPLPDNDQDVPF